MVDRDDHDRRYPVIMVCAQG